MASTHRLHTIALLISAVLLGLGMSSCASETSSTVTAPAAAVSVPAQLDNVESAAEDAYDLALSGDINGARAKAQALSDDWDNFKPDAVNAGASSQLVQQVDQAVTAFTQTASQSSNKFAVARAANGVSRYMDQLYRLYSPTVPPAVMRLDYLGRELALDGRQGRLQQARQTLTTTRSTWQALQPTLIDAGGQTVAGGYATTLDAIAAAIDRGDGAQLTRQANHSLDLVDDMERVFLKTRAPNV